VVGAWESGSCKHAVVFSVTATEFGGQVEHVWILALLLKALQFLIQVRWLSVRGGAGGGAATLFGRCV